MSRIKQVLRRYRFISDQLAISRDTVENIAPRSDTYYYHSCEARQNLKLCKEEPFGILVDLVYLMFTK